MIAYRLSYLTAMVSTAREFRVTWAWLLASAIVLVTSPTTGASKPPAKHAVHVAAPAYPTHQHPKSHNQASPDGEYKFGGTTYTEWVVPVAISGEYIVVDPNDYDGDSGDNENTTELIQPEIIQLKSNHHTHTNKSDGKLVNQSPIDIEKVQVGWLKTPLVFSSGWKQKPKAVTVVNNGHYVLLKYATSTPITISGGPLGTTTYTFKQLHWHWGKRMQGSEHELARKSETPSLLGRLPLEAHFVFQAGCKKNAVLGVLYEPNAADNPVLYTATKNTGRIAKYRSSYIETKDVFPLADYLPDNSSSFFTYLGSLTTPPYTTGVQWVVFTDRSFVSPHQVAQFRIIKNSHGKNINQNFRPVQKLGRRTVKLALGAMHTG